VDDRAKSARVPRPSVSDRIRATTTELEPTAHRGGYAAALAACAANLLSYFAIGTVVPVLPLYMRGSLHASDVSIGVIMASYAVTTLFCRPLGGLWGDRAGYRRPAMVGALLILAGTASYGVVPSALWLLACRLVVGAGEGMSQAACVTWAVSLAPARRRAAVLSYAGVSGWAGVALGALAGDAVLARASAQGAFLCGAAGPLLGLGVLACMPSARAEAKTRASMLRLGRALGRQGAAYVLVTVGYAGVLTFGVLLLQSSGAAAAPSLLLRAFVGGVIAGRVLFADLPGRLGPARTAGLCAFAQAGGTFAVAIFAAHPWWVATGGALAGTAFGLSFPSLALDALGRVSGSDRGVAIGIVSAFFDVGMAASGVLLGWIAKGHGYPAAFVFAAACAAAAGALVWRPRSRP
jgi:MFS family permease